MRFLKVVSKFKKKASLAKWLSVRLRSKWFWVRVQLQSLHIKIYSKKDTKISQS